MLHWRPELNTGDPDIDREHQEIYAKLNEIGEAIRKHDSPEVISQLIAVLQHYSNAHFRREERAMSCSRCPMHGANCAAHAYFSERLKIWMTIISSSGLPVSLLEDIHEETCRWIEQHIEKIDTSLKEENRESQQPWFLRFSA